MTKLRTAFAASIILNLFLAAALIGGYASLQKGGGMINAGSLRVAGAELPVAERRPFRLALRQTRSEMKPMIIVARNAKIEAARLLRQPVIDQTAVLAALDRARIADMAIRSAVEARAVAFTAALPPADRAKLADAMKQRADKVLPGVE